MIVKAKTCIARGILEVDDLGLWSVVSEENPSKFVGLSSIDVEEIGASQAKGQTIIVEGTFSVTFEGYVYFENIVSIDFSEHS